MTEVKNGRTVFFMLYHQKEWRQSLDRKTPAMVYFNTAAQKQMAACARAVRWPEKIARAPTWENRSTMTIQE